MSSDPEPLSGLWPLTMCAPGSLWLLTVCASGE